MLNPKYFLFLKVFLVLLFTFSSIIHFELIFIRCKVWIKSLLFFSFLSLPSCPLHNKCSNWPSTFYQKGLAKTCKWWCVSIWPPPLVPYQVRDILSLAFMISCSLPFHPDPQKGLIMVSGASRLCSVSSRS